MPITTFETITHDLTDKELAIVPVIVQKLRHYGKANPIKEPDLVKKFNDSGKFDIKLTSARFRKIVNYIRNHLHLPVIAGSKGYFMSENETDIYNQAKSLFERGRENIRTGYAVLSLLKDTDKADELMDSMKQFLK